MISSELLNLTGRQDLLAVSTKKERVDKTYIRTNEKFPELLAVNTEPRETVDRIYGRTSERQHQEKQKQNRPQNEQIDRTC